MLEEIRTTFVALRRRAEEVLQGQPVDLSNLATEDAQNLIHELQVHQIELELQNEELFTAQQALETSRNKYADLYDFAPVGYFTLDEDGVIIEANLTGATMLGMERGSLIKQPLAAFVAGTDQDAYYLYRRQLFTTQKLRACEVNLIRKNGARFSARLEGVRVQDRDGQASYCRLTVSDIGDLKKAEESLRESQQHYKQLLEAVTDYIYTVEIDHGQAAATTHSPGCVAVTGYASQDYEADPDLWYRMIQETDREMVMEQISRVLAGEDIAPFEHRIVHRDGTTRWVKNTWVPRYDDESNLVAYDGLIRDVTERKEAEEALAKERNLLRALVDNLPDYVYIKDTESRFLLANEAVQRHLGADSVDEVVGKTDFDFSPVELARQYFADEKALFQADQPLISHEERVYDHESDTYKWVLTTKVPFHDSQGKILGLVGLNRDITNLKQAEEALHESEAFNLAVLSSLQAHIAVLDQNGMIIAVNQAWKKFGRENGNPSTDRIGVGANYLAVCRQAGNSRTKHEAHLALTGIQDVLAGTKTNFTLEYACHSPSAKRWFLMMVTPLSDGFEGAVVSHVDITDRRQIEEALRQSEARLDAIINTATDAIITIDAEQRIVLFNLAAAWIFGYTPEEIIGQPLGLLLPQRYRDFHFQQIQQFGQSGVVARAMSSVDLWGLRANGQEFPIEAMISQVEVSGKKLYTVILRDITERREAEQEKARLFEAVNRQREQLRALTRRLTDYQEAERKQLARELHDQVGQNLTALGLNLNIIRSQIPTHLPKINIILDRIDDSLMLTEQTTERIRDVMANLRPPVLDDYGLMAALHWYGQRFASRGGFEVVINGEEFQPRLEPPIENALFRITQEAITNIAKHAQASEVIINLDDNGNLVRLIITDDGQGFDNTFLSQPTQKRGWGLLSMIERAEAIGGYCHIDSSPNQGTQITVEVPR